MKPGWEFWRDYFSVRQWKIGLKESLLLRLPAIYHLADEILVHIADIPPILRVAPALFWECLEGVKCEVHLPRFVCQHEECVLDPRFEMNVKQEAYFGSCFRKYSRIRHK